MASKSRARSQAKPTAAVASKSRYRSASKPTGPGVALTRRIYSEARRKMEDVRDEEKEAAALKFLNGPPADSVTSGEEGGARDRMQRRFQAVFQSSSETGRLNRGVRAIESLTSDNHSIREEALKEKARINAKLEEMDRLTSERLQEAHEVFSTVEQMRERLDPTVFVEAISQMRAMLEELEVLRNKMLANGASLEEMMRQIDVAIRAMHETVASLTAPRKNKENPPSARGALKRLWAMTSLFKCVEGTAQPRGAAEPSALEEGTTVLKKRSLPLVGRFPELGQVNPLPPRTTEKHVNEAQEAEEDKPGELTIQVSFTLSTGGVRSRERRAPQPRPPNVFFPMPVVELEGQTLQIERVAGRSSHSWFLPEVVHSPPGLRPVRVPKSMLTWDVSEVSKEMASSAVKFSQLMKQREMRKASQARQQARPQARREQQHQQPQ
ncbi:unnamed protein product [Polarella glacialis]|uniref:Uncharacterized protein n=1 Tax=Polarella glacialis TaxID=89957 RepID=A0A813D8T4_POLGL|nr:unnamed protein product [Polarella glacialis]